MKNMLIAFTYKTMKGKKKNATFLMDYSESNIKSCKNNVKRGYTPSGKYKLESWNLRFFKLVKVG
jgi:hypothetical protein